MHNDTVTTATLIKMSRDMIQKSRAISQRDYSASAPVEQPTLVDQSQAAAGWVACLYPPGQGFAGDNLQKVETLIGQKIKLCSTWFELINEVNNQRLKASGNNSIRCVVIVYVSHLVNGGSVMSEITDMITTLNKCLAEDHRSPLTLGALVDGTCTPVLLKQIQKAGFAGLIPTCDMFGVEKTAESINALLSSNTAWDKKMVDVIMGNRPKPVHRRDHITLTARQQEVMNLICRGMPNKSIARVLKISDSTVKLHVSAILKEYGLRTRTQLALAGIQEKNKDTTSKST